MRNDDIRVCESIIADLPRLYSICDMMEAQLRGGGGDGERVDGGAAVPYEQRVVEDARLERWKAAAEGIREEILKLNREARVAVWMKLVGGSRWEEIAELLMVSCPTARRWVKTAVRLIARSVIKYYPDVLDMRETWEQTVPKR